jgi:hypothetical protein
MQTTFGARQLGIQAGSASNFPMEQLPLRLLARIDGPSVVPPDNVAQIQSYREAVRMCFALRRVTGMNRKTVAELAGMHTPHISEYLSEDDGREMPAKYIAAFEAVCGNTCVSQWIAMNAKLTVLEEMQARKVA